jgi:hypothetical protein
MKWDEILGGWDSIQIMVLIKNMVEERLQGYSVIKYDAIARTRY